MPDTGLADCDRHGGYVAAELCGAGAKITGGDGTDQDAPSSIGNVILNGRFWPMD